MQIEATYELHIKHRGIATETLNTMLGVAGTAVEPDLWCYSVTETTDDDEYDFINQFLDILENKFDALHTLGINRSDILFWYLYCHDGECSFQFHPSHMKRLGLADIKLCVLGYQNQTDDLF